MMASPLASVANMKPVATTTTLLSFLLSLGVQLLVLQFVAASADGRCSTVVPAAFVTPKSPVAVPAFRTAICPVTSTAVHAYSYPYYTQVLPGNDEPLTDTIVTLLAEAHHWDVVPDHTYTGMVRVPPGTFHVDAIEDE
jgi:hypothetical protein